MPFPDLQEARSFRILSRDHLPERIGGQLERGSSRLHLRPHRHGLPDGAARFRGPLRHGRLLLCLDAALPLPSLRPSHREPGK